MKKEEKYFEKKKNVKNHIHQKNKKSSKIITEKLLLPE